MLYKVDFKESAFRWVYNYIYKRLVDGCLASDETEAIALSRITALINNDPAFILLIDVKDNNLAEIQAHCLLHLLSQPDGNVHVFCEQLFSDTGHAEYFTNLCLEYIERTLTYLYPVTEIVMFTAENKFKAFKKKYEFSVKKVLMTRTIKRE